tara:strand:+ start:1066 stop:1230 length:165 start_codon:yes stop_codon:yes gene_type:complete
MNTIEQIIELYGRGETEAAEVMIDSEETLVELMKARSLDYGQLIDYLIEQKARG